MSEPGFVTAFFVAYVVGCILGLINVVGLISERWSPMVGATILTLLGLAMSYLAVWIML